MSSPRFCGSVSLCGVVAEIPSIFADITIRASEQVLLGAVDMWMIVGSYNLTGIAMSTRIL